MSYQSVGADDSDETSRLLKGLRSQNDQQQETSPTQVLINFIVCAGLISLIVIGSMCLSRDEKGINSTMCENIGHDGAVAMVAVGGTFIGLQIFCVCCLIFCFGCILAMTASQG